jgi:polysaccharide biosynthesis transport protein
MSRVRPRQLVARSASRGAGAAPGTQSAPPSLDKHLTDYLRMLVRRRWIALTTVGVVLAIAGIHLSLALPIYQATVQILIEHENKEQFSLQQGVAADRETTDYYNTQYTILQSRSLAARTLDAMNGWTQPELMNADLQPSGIVNAVADWATKTIRQLRGHRTPVEKPAATKTVGGGMATVVETPAQSAAIAAFLSRLTIVPVKTSRLVNVNVRAADPKFAAAAANSLAKAYIEQNLEIRMTSSKETSDWLTGQLSAQRDRIRESENALQRYRENHDAVSLTDRQNIVTQKLSELNGMVTKAKGDRISRETIYNQMLAIQKREAPLDTLPSILSNAYLQQLKGELARLQAEYAQRSQDLGDQNPVMIALRGSVQAADAKLQRELAKQVDALQNEYEGARALETSLTQALEVQKREVTAMNRTGIDYTALERDVASNRQIFESLLSHTREKGIAGELKASDVRVIDAAQVPREPVWPNRNETWLYAAFFGSLLGVVLAFFFEYVDDRIKTPEEIKTYLGLPFLGMVPVISGKEVSEDRPLLHKRATVSPMFSEAFRSVRTNVIFTAEQHASSIVVTSTGPGEGKTLVASNVAIALAQAGQQVILIDADMRRPRVHDLFGRDQEPGLSNMLVGKPGDHEHAVQPYDVSGLFTLPAGHIPPNPSELLGSKRFKDLIAGFKDRFDWVIIDSPPVMAVTDACLIAHDATGVLFVVGSEMTNRDTASVALDQLESAQARFVGAVLNRVELKRHGYYYSRYYRKDYVEHYAKSAHS